MEQTTEGVTVHSMSLSLSVTCSSPRTYGYSGRVRAASIACVPVSVLHAASCLSRAQKQALTELECL